MKRLVFLLTSFLIAAPCIAAPVDDPDLVIESVSVHDWGVQVIYDDASFEWFVADPVALEYAIESEPLTIDQCLAAAQVACPYGIKRFYFRSGDPSICEFGCNTTGTGG